MARTYYMSIDLNFSRATMRNSRGETAYYRCCRWMIDLKTRSCMLNQLCESAGTSGIYTTRGQNQIAYEPSRLIYARIVIRLDSY